MAEIIMAFAPLVFLIIYALKTRKMADAMILATLLAWCCCTGSTFSPAPSTRCTVRCPTRRTSSCCASPSASEA